MRVIIITTLLISNLCFGQSNKTEKKNSFGVHFSVFDLAPLIKYERVIRPLSRNILLSADIHFLYDWKGNTVFLPINGLVRFGNRFNAFIGVGIANYLDFTPFPASQEERQNWAPSGGQWISYPYNIRPDFITGIEYGFGNCSVSLKSINILYLYRNYDVPEYFDLKNEVMPVLTLGIDYHF